MLKNGVPAGDDVDFQDESVEFWRVYNYIECSTSFETAGGDPEVLRMSGKAFGRFNKQLKDFDAAQLMESIPHFHDTVYRMNSFFDTVEKDPKGRAAQAAREIAVIRENRGRAAHPRHAQRYENEQHPL